MVASTLKEWRRGRPPSANDRRQGTSFDAHHSPGRNRGRGYSQDEKGGGDGDRSRSRSRFREDERYHPRRDRRYDGRHPRDDRDRYDPHPRDRDRERDRPRDRDRSRSRGRHRRHRDDDDKHRVKEWPPPFDSDGAAYIFDARSGFFYEGSSDFFYDPKNKLYYGNKKKGYFRYVPGASPEYQPIDQSTQAGSGGDPSSLDLIATTLLDPFGNPVPMNNANPNQTASAAPIDTPNERNPAESGGASSVNQGVKATGMKIAISINKTKKVASVVNPVDIKLSTPELNATSAASSAAAPSLTQKKHSADIHKWAERGREMRNTVETSDLNIKASNDPAMDKLHEMTRPKIFTRTKLGNPVCLICKRKFQNMKELHQHVKFSKLHKKNLLQYYEMEEAKKYRDRAQERRFMYGPEMAPANSAQRDAVEEAAELAVSTGPSLTHARTVVSTEIVSPEENLGNSNIGNQMLQKLGWKSGASLGRKTIGKQGTSNEDDSDNQDDVKQKLKQDWEKIESIAGNMKQSYGNGIGHSTLK